MEGCFCKPLRLVLRTFKPHYEGWSGLRSYSQYNPFFKESSIVKTDLDKMFEDHSEAELKTMKFKAVRSDQTCSIFYDKDVNKITNYIMRGGNKVLARELVEKSFTLIKHIQLRKYNEEKDEKIKNNICLDPLKIFQAAVENVTPKLVTQPLRKSGRWYKIPVAISSSKARHIGMKWIVEVSNIKGTKDHFFRCFAKELIAASNNEGQAVNKKIEMHKLCENNRSYAHYRWG